MIIRTGGTAVDRHIPTGQNTRFNTDLLARSNAHIAATIAIRIKGEIRTCLRRFTAR